MPPDYRSRGRGGLSTTRRGYDGEHRKARAKALKQLQDGEPCPFCERPMYPEQDLDFDHVVPLAVGGAKGERRLSHASCNRAAGAKLGNRMRRKGQRPVVPSVAVRAARPASGTPCYNCGGPMLSGQPLRGFPRSLGEGEGWSHKDCGTRWTSVLAGRL